MKHPYDNIFRKRIIMLKDAYRIKDKLMVLLFFIANPLKVKLKNKIMFKNSEGVFVGRPDVDLWVCQKDYGFETKPFMKIDGGTFVDVGANIGRFSIFVANRLKGKGKVICFEPEKENCKILKKNIELNKLDNMSVIEKGCFSENRKIEFYISKESTRHSIYDKTDMKTEIYVVKLDDYLKNEKDIRLIKIDTERADYFVLKGAKKIIKKWRPIIVYEVNDNDNPKVVAEMNDFFNKENYKIIEINESNSLALPQERKLTKELIKHLENVKECYSKAKFVKRF